MLNELAKLVGDRSKNKRVIFLTEDAKKQNETTEHQKIPFLACLLAFVVSCGGFLLYTK